MIATADVIIGDDGPKKIVSTYGGARIRGGGGDDEPHGAEGDDAIYGGKGKNAIHGGEGTDTCVRPGPQDGARYCE